MDTFNFLMALGTKELWNQETQPDKELSNTVTVQNTKEIGRTETLMATVFLLFKIYLDMRVLIFFFEKNFKFF